MVAERLLSRDTGNLKPRGDAPRSVRALSVAVAVAALALLAGCVAAPPPADGPALHAPARETRTVATLETDLGEIRMVLLPEFAPRTVAHFTRLAGAGFYDGLLWHRVVDDFVIQTGDPSGTGQFGSEKTIPLETHPDAFFAGGSVGIARDLDPDSGTSQIFICEKPQPHLREPRGVVSRLYGNFTMFAQVVEGMETVRRIAAVPVVPGLDRPVEGVRLVRVTLAEETFDGLRAMERYPRETHGPVTTHGITTVLETNLRRTTGEVNLTFYTEDAQGARALADPRVRLRLDGWTDEPFPAERLGDDPAVVHVDVGIPVEDDDAEVELLDGDRRVATFRLRWTTPEHGTVERRA